MVVDSVTVKWRSLRIRALLVFPSILTSLDLMKPFDGVLAKPITGLDIKRSNKGMKQRKIPLRQ